MTEYTKLAPYQTHRADDGITWVTLEPLLQEVLERQEDAKAIDISKMSDDEIRGIDFTILAIESVANFIKALLTEHQLKQEVEEANNG
tara:strand:+ start:976 stop:1239 length:264 start_codon:yes stop_codon:yes gene_type:complete